MKAAFSAKEAILTLWRFVVVDGGLMIFLEMKTTTRSKSGVFDS